MDKRNVKSDDTEIEKYKFHQHKISISINKIDFNKIVVYNKVSFSKNDFIKDFSLAIKMLKKLEIYAYSFQN